MATWSAVRLGVVALFSIAVGWMLFAISYHDDAEAHDQDGIAGAMPGKPTVRRRGLAKNGRPFRSPAPEIKPMGRPAYVEWLDDTFNLRQCQCRRDWKEQPAGTSICRCGGNCHPSIDPYFLTEAKGQSLCSLEEPTGYNCYADCANEAEPEVKWFAMPCGGGDKQAECDRPILAGRKKAANEAAAAKAAPAAAPPAAAPPAPVPEPAPAQVAEPAEHEEKAGPKAEIGGVALPFDPKEYVDLRGLQCEVLDGKERCFLEDEQGRELCPEHVTADYVTNPSDQYLCSAEMSAQYYCTVGCQEGHPEVRWGAHEVAWCSDPRNSGSCPKRAPPIRRSEYKVKEWSAPPEPVLPCRARWEAGERPKQPVAEVTVGLLTHEPRSFRDSMQTYEDLGLFDVVSEFLIYINKRRPEVDAVANEFAAKHENIRIMGDETNVGILRGMNFLIGNASQPYFMFLERDFQLIEPATCVVEQLEAAVKMVKAETAHVVRFRHKRHPGRPNWAARMFRGHEDDVFKNGQPNLFCNHFYWYEEPEKRWPDKMWICNDSPKMHCSDSFYCNWTNNPQLWSKAWWAKEYVAHFDKFKHNDPFYDIEVYMNWEPNSWNDRKWTVAQGDGLFKHVDRGNFGTL